MKQETCRMCSRGVFHCRSGEHVKTPGKIHSGFGAVSDSEWDCPNCAGRGTIATSFLDRLCQAIYERGRKVNRKLHPRSC